MTDRFDLRRALGAATVQVCVRLPTLAAVLLCRRFRNPPGTDGHPAILVVRLDGIGDCVMTEPLIQQLRRRFPDARLTVVTQPVAEWVFSGLTEVDEVLVLRPFKLAWLPGRARLLLGAISLFQQSLKHRRFDIAINPRWDADVYLATFLCALSRAPTTVGYEDATSSEKQRLNAGFQAVWNVPLQAGPLQHEVERNLAIGHALGCAGGPLRPQLPVSDWHRDQARVWTDAKAGELVVGLGLPAGEPQRRWIAERYVATLRGIEAAYAIKLVIFADDMTAEQAAKIQMQFPNARIAKLLPLPQVAAIIAQCAVFIGSDSGLGHVAAAVGCRTVTLSAHALDGDKGHGSSPLRFRPYGNASVVVQPTTHRAGCEHGCDRPEPHCILDIDPDAVAAATLALLGRLKDADTPFGVPALGQTVASPADAANNPSIE